VLLSPAKAGIFSSFSQNAFFMKQKKTLYDLFAHSKQNIKSLVTVSVYIASRNRRDGDEVFKLLPFSVKVRKYKIV